MSVFGETEAGNSQKHNYLCPTYHVSHTVLFSREIQTTSQSLNILLSSSLHVPKFEIVLVFFNHSLLVGPFTKNCDVIMEHKKNLS
jgi:hypothetical protein